MQQTEKIGFIGIGNMGYAMLKGALRYLKPDEVVYTDVRLDHMEKIKKETGVSFFKDKKELVEHVKYIVLAVKPQYLSNVAEELKGSITKEQVLISILPGISIDYLKEVFVTEAKVVRAMPNTPALVGEAMTGISFSKDAFTEQERGKVLAFFGSFGQYEVVGEEMLNAVVCASGSSPAYVYMFIEALADSAVKYGIPREKAYIFAAQTVLGSAKMVLETGQHPAKLKDDVCSPGGTTIAAVSALEEYGFRNAIIKATDKCYEKTVMLAVEKPDHSV